MAKEVPYQPFQEKVPGGIPDDYQRISAGAESFGGRVAQATEGLGRQVSQVSNDLTRTVIAYQSLQNETLAKEADIAMNGEIRGTLIDPNNGFLTKQGKDAATGFGAVNEQIQSIYRKHREALPSDEARRMFDQVAVRNVTYSQDRAATHAAAQNKAWITKTAEARIASTIQDAANNATDDVAFQRSLNTITSEVESRAAVFGRGPDDPQTKEDLQHYQAEAIKYRLEALAQTDIDKARKLYEGDPEKGIKGYKETMPPDMRHGIEASILGMVNKQQSDLGKRQYETKQAVQSDLSAVERTGQGNPNLTFDTVRDYLGPAAAAQWQADRQTNQQAYMATIGMETMPTEQINARLAQLYQNAENNTHVPDYQRLTQVHDKAAKYAEGIIKQRAEDPAGSVAKDPEVMQAAAARGKDAAALRSNLITARMAAQERAGIPDDERSPITKQEALQMTVPLRRILPGTEMQVARDLKQAFEENYGDSAELAMRYAIRLHTMNQETGQALGNILRKFGTGTLPTRTEARTSDNQAEVGAAEGAVPTQIDPNTGSRVRAGVDPDTGAQLGGQAQDIPRPVPPPDAIAWLRKDPTEKRKKGFDREYGEGAADRLLKTYPVR